MKSGQQVTVCWQDEWVSFVHWNEDGLPGELSQSSELEASECSWHRYVLCLEDLLEELPQKRYKLNWVVVCESFPFGLGLEARAAAAMDFPGIPEWLERCWSLLPARYLPDKIYSGSDCAYNILLNNALFAKPGTGLYFRHGKRSYFFGYNEDSRYQRVSRIQSSEPSGKLDADWIRQTQMLYQLKTNSPLNQILTLENVESNANDAGGLPEILPFPDSPNWLKATTSLTSRGLFLFHGGAVHSGNSKTLEIPLLSKRRRAIHMDSVFRWAACLVMGGWLLLLMGACRGNDPAAQTDAGTARQWDEAKKQWAQNDSRWGEYQQDQAIRNAPFAIAALIAGTLPRDLELQRMRCERPEDQLEVVRILVEGRNMKGSGDIELRNWVEKIRSEPGGIELEDLALKQMKGELHFSIEGIHRINATSQ